MQAKYTFYFGQECPHCEKMQKLLDAIESEKGKLFDRVEVWHDKQALKKLEKIDNDRCGGIPFLYNPANDTFLCGEIEEDELREWIAK